jgi:MFS family permease
MARSAASADRPGWLYKSVILLASIPMALASAAPGPILPKMSAALAHGADDLYMVKMVIGIIGLAVVLGGPVAGLMIDRFDRRRLLVVSGVVFAAAGAAPFFLDNLPLILATRFVTGFAANAAFVLGATLVADGFEEAERAQWMGVTAAIAIIGGIGGMLVAGALGDLGWRWAFLTYLAGLPLAALAWVGLKGGPTASGAQAAGHGSRAPKGAPFPVALGLLALLSGIVVYAPSVYIPFRLTALGAVKPSQISLAMTLSMASCALAAAFLGQVRRRVSSRAVFCLCFATMGAGIAVIATAPGFPLALAGMVVMGLGVGAIFPNLMTAAADMAHESARGRALGVVRSALEVAPGLGVTALEPVARQIGGQGVLMATAALAGLLLVGMAADMVRRGVLGAGAQRSRPA